MRGRVLVLLICFCLFLASTTEVSVGDVLELEGEEYEVTTTSSDAIVLKHAGFSKIYWVDDCVLGAEERFCLTRSDNESATIDFYTLTRSLKATSSVPASATLGEEVLYELLLENTGELEAEVFVNIHLPSNFSRLKGVNSVGYYSGVLRAGRQETISFFFLAQQETTINATISGASNETLQDVVRVDDYLSWTTRYTDNPSVGVTYNFSIDVRISEQLSAGEEVFLSVTPPQGVLLRNYDSVYTKELLNETTVWFLYEVLPEAAGDFVVRITDAYATRTEHLPVQAQPGRPLALSYDSLGVGIVNQAHPVRFSVHNPNNASILMRASVESVLLSEQEQQELAANQTINFSYTVTPNRTGEYGFRIQAYYLDANDEEVRTNIFLPLQITQEAPIHTTPSIHITGPSLLQGLNATLTATVQGIVTPVTVEWFSQNQSVFVDTNVTNSSTLLVNASGVYTARVNNLSHSFSVSQPAPISTSQEEQQEVVGEEEHSSSSFLFILITAVFLIGAVLVWRLQASVLRAQEQEQLLEVLSMKPTTPQQQQLQQELLQRLMNKHKKE
ncbi:MAG: hypothetical protein ACMXYD_00915 [Candidatus Woesearchaeota archaeon]